MVSNALNLIITSSFMCAVQIFNTDYWDFLYHDVISANGPAAFLFYLFGLVFLNYYLANLVQAVVALSYQVEEDETDEDGDEIGIHPREPKLRFVYDPYKLRNRSARENRTRSLLSLRNVTERHFGLPHNDSKPIAVVKPQDGGEKELPVQTQPRKSLEVASRPPSVISVSQHHEVGFWDRNPNCCFQCCHSRPFMLWLKVQHYLFLLVTDPFFELLITVTIIVNTISMAAFYHGMPQEWVNVLDTINNVCTYIFITECVLKLSAMCQNYFVNRWNWLDFIVVIGSIIDIVFSNVNVSVGGFNTSIIRLLRLVRFFINLQPIFSFLPFFTATHLEVGAVMEDDANTAGDHSWYCWGHWKSYACCMFFVPSKPVSLKLFILVAHCNIHLCCHWNAIVRGNLQ